MSDRILEIKKLIDETTSLIGSELSYHKECIDAVEARIAAIEERIVIIEKRIEERMKKQEEREKKEDEVEDNCFSFDEDEESIDFEVKEVTISPKNEGKILGDIFFNDSSIVDKARKKSFSWMNDMPGTQVDTVEEAISLNDRLFFIRELFDGDDFQFSLTLERINETASFKEVLNYTRAAFPDWDEESDAVYRFYMLVRRKCRD